MTFWPIFMGLGMRFFPSYEVSDFCADCSVARFLESRGMLEDALEIATDPDYKFDLAVQLGRLEIAKVSLLSFQAFWFGMNACCNWS
jgi:hypothetical protein